MFGLGNRIKQWVSDAVVAGFGDGLQRVFRDDQKEAFAGEAIEVENLLGRERRPAKQLTPAKAGRRG